MSSARQPPQQTQMIDLIIHPHHLLDSDLGMYYVVFVHD